MKYIPFLLRWIILGLLLFFIAKPFQVTLFTFLMHGLFLVVAFLVYVALALVHSAMGTLLETYKMMRSHDKS